MSDRNGTRRRKPPADDLDGLITETVAESLRAGLYEDRGWRRLGSRRAADRTPADLEAARNDSRRLLEGSEYDDGNEFAIGAAGNRVNYVVGEAGFQYEATPNPDGPADPAAVKAVQAYVTAFGEVNDLPGVEAETLYRADRDGSALLRLFAPERPEIPEVRFVAPERLCPPGPAWSLDFPYDEEAARWGVITKPGDRGCVLGYVYDDGTGPAFVREWQVMHLKLNTDSDGVMGWPTFAPAAVALRRAEQLLIAGTAGTKAQAKFAIIHKMANLTAQRAENIVNNLTTRLVPQGDGTPPREETEEPVPYGAKLRVPAGDEVTFPAPVASQGVIDLIQANLRAAGQSVKIPEWMFTGLPDAKYSNAFETFGPALREFGKLQRVLRQFFGEGRLKTRASLVWRAVRLGVRMRLLPATALTAVRIKCTAPSLEVRDKAGEAATNATYIDKGVKPVALVQQELGYDPKELAELEAKFPGPKPAGGDPGGGGKPPRWG